MSGKVCVKCKEFKTFEMYSKRKAMKDGHRSECKECSLIRNRVYYSDPDIKAREAKRQREDYKDKRKEYQQKNKDKLNAKQREYRELYPERYKETFRKYRKKNSGKVNAWNRNRVARKLNATPPWADLGEIEKIYIKRQEMGPDYHVDHIIPLQSDVVCGLHWEGNLRIIPKQENLRKSNKVLEQIEGY